jgi:hypothetical protein
MIRCEKRAGPLPVLMPSRCHVPKECQPTWGGQALAWLADRHALDRHEMTSGDTRGQQPATTRGPRVGGTADNARTRTISRRERVVMTVVEMSGLHQKGHLSEQVNQKKHIDWDSTTSEMTYKRARERTDRESD